MDKKIKEYLSKLGKKGGSSTSPAKQKASRLNGLKNKGKKRINSVINLSQQNISKNNP